MRFHLLILFTCFDFLCVAQTPITNAYFPAVGNTLIMARATNTSAFGINTSPTGGSNLTWDYRQLRPQALDTQRFIAPNTEGGRLFPSATLTLKPDSNVQIPFYRRTDSTFELVGLRGLYFQGVFIPIVVKPHSPLKERHAPLRLGEVYEQTAGFQVSFPASVAPDSLLRSSPFAVPDSIRITYDVQRRDSVDAWGTVRIPNGDFPVLRERQRESIKTKVEIYYAFLGPNWLDVTTLVLTGLAQPFYTERLYLYYWHATTQEPIAIVETINLAGAGIRTAQYKAIAQRVDVGEVVDMSDKLTVFPNPTHTNIKIDFEKINAPIASVQVVDVLGHGVFYEKINNQKSLDVVVNHWQNGAYLLYLLDKEGRIIGKRMFTKN